MKQFSLQLSDLPLSGALLLRPAVFADERGYFQESYSVKSYAKAGVMDAFVQDNVSYSRRNVLRGLHGDPRMSKIIQVLVGEVYDVIVDLRRDSPTYLRWHAELLRAEDHLQIYAPSGFVHGFFVLSDEAIMSYKQSVLYDPTMEFGVAWNDSDLKIDWPLNGITPILAPKDEANPTLRNLAYL